MIFQKVGWSRGGGMKQHGSSCPRTRACSSRTDEELLEAAQVLPGHQPCGTSPQTLKTVLAKLLHPLSHVSRVWVARRRARGSLETLAPIALGFAPATHEGIAPPRFVHRRPDGEGRWEQPSPPLLARGWRRFCYRLSPRDRGRC